MAREVSRYEGSLSPLEPSTFLGCRNNVLFEPEERTEPLDHIWQQSAGIYPALGRQVVAGCLAAPPVHVEPVPSQELHLSEPVDGRSAAERSIEASLSSRNNVDALLERMQALAQARRALVAQLQVLQRLASGGLSAYGPMACNTA